METSLYYGCRSEIRFDLPESAVILNRRGPGGEPLDDPAAAVAAALANPLDFPPLARAVTPEDRVVLALAPGVPQAEAIVAGVVYSLSEAGIDAGNITIILEAAEAALAERDVASGLPAPIRGQIKVVRHDPSRRETLAYLAANQGGQAIYFNREICDADLVLPVVCLRAGDGFGHTGVGIGLFPTFADEASQRRFQALSSHDEPVHRRRREEEADEAAWLLGVMLTIAVLPGAGDGVLQVLAGERRAVGAEGQRLCRQAWAFDVPQPADLVIATVEGGCEQQTWENVGRALNAASRVAAGDGAIVVCSELDHPPGASLQRLASADAGEEVLRQIQRDRRADTLTAAHFCRALAGNRVYLRSRLDGDVVESLGLAHVGSDEEIVRLSARHQRCIVIGNAQFAAPRQAESC